MNLLISIVLALSLLTNSWAMDGGIFTDIRTDTFITGSSGMSWGDGIGKLFRDVVKDGMVIGTDVAYYQGDGLDSFTVPVSYCGYRSRAVFTFEDNSLVLIRHFINVDDLAEVVIILTEVGKVGDSCGFKGTEDDPEFSFYWYDRRSNFMSMLSEKQDDGYRVTITQVESSFWARMAEESQ